MTRMPGPLSVVTPCAVLAVSGMAAADGPGILPEITTPDRVQTQLGTLNLKDGAPTVKPAQEMYHTMDFHPRRGRSSIVSGALPRVRSVRAFSVSAQRTTRSSFSPS
jgi:hypothetical protein